MADDDNPFVDDRAKQDTLFGDDSEAARTMDRSGTTVTGSDTFADDRDSAGTDPGEQQGLFSETEELEGQQALGGGTATEESGGFFEADSAGTETPFSESAPLEQGENVEEFIGTDPVTGDDEFISVRASRGKFYPQFLSMDDGTITDKQTIGQPRRDPESALQTARREFADQTGQSFGPSVSFEGPASDLPVPMSARDEVFQTTASPPSPLTPEDFGAMRPEDTPGISDDPASIGTTREEDPNRGAIAGALSAAQVGVSPTRSVGIDFTATPATQLLDADAGGEGGGSAPRFTDVFAAGTATAATASSGSDIDVPDVEERGALSTEQRGLIDLAQTRRFETESSAPGTVSVTPTPSGEADYRVERPVFNEAEDGRGGTRPERVGTDVWTMDQSQFSRAVERGQYTLANDNVRGVQADSGARRRFDGLPDPDDAGLTLPGQNADVGSEDSGGRGMAFDAEPPVQLLEAESATEDSGGRGMAFSATPPTMLFDPADASDTGTGRGQTRELDFGRRGIANDVRERLPDDALTGKYDRRYTTLEVDTSKLSERQLDRLAGEAADATAFEDEKTGQAELTERERREIDFSETNVPAARSAKAAFQSEGVDDWLSFYDAELSVDENKRLAERAGREDGGRRSDFAEDTTRQRAARAFRMEQQGLRDQAIKGARQGNEEAIGILVNEIGMSEERARSFAETAESGDERAALAETADERARGDVPGRGIDADAEPPTLLFDPTASDDSGGRGLEFSATPATTLLSSAAAAGRQQARAAGRGDDGLRDTDLIRVEANGRFNAKPVTDARNSPGVRALGNGRYIGSDYVAPPDPGAPIKRDPQTGEFTLADGNRPRSTDNQQASPNSTDTADGLIRSEANGRFNEGAVDDAPNSPGLRAEGNGRYVGDEVETSPDPDNPIGRDSQTGQYTLSDFGSGATTSRFTDVFDAGTAMTSRRLTDAPYTVFSANASEVNK